MNKITTTYIFGYCVRMHSFWAISLFLDKLLEVLISDLQFARISLGVKMSEGSRKFNTFWEGHKNLAQSSSMFWLYLVTKRCPRNLSNNKGQNKKYYVFRFALFSSVRKKIEVKI